jgi:hypothetical protein
MNLIQLRTEVLDHGFDQSQYGARTNTYLNDALSLICRRVDYYTDETVYDFQTASGTTSYSIPQNFAKLRSLRFTNLTGNIGSVELEAVALRDIDRAWTTMSQPYAYAMDAANVHLYPTPDGIYAIELRYWQMPNPLAADTDVPSLPADAHNMLWMYAVAECYAADDDPQTSQYWQGRFEKSLSEFAASAKFPNDDAPSIVKGMWDQDRVLRWSFPRG